MDKKALVKAQSRLRVAQGALADLKTCTSYTAFSDTWYIFLHASKGIYTTLEQGAKMSAQARQWFHAKNEERKKDELLRYVTEARNDDEHGIEEVTTYVPKSTVLGARAPGFSRQIMDEHGNTFEDCSGTYEYLGEPPAQFPRLMAMDGKPILGRVTTPHAKLARVRDRSGYTYDPPTSHLGQSIQDDSPVEIARLTVDYLEALLAEAGGFHKP